MFGWVHARVRFSLLYKEYKEVAQYYARIELTLDWAQDEIGARGESNVWLHMV